MKVLFNNNLPNQAGDVIINPINPENPDSKPHAAARIISNKDWVHSIRFGCGDGYFLGIFPVNNFESRIIRIFRISRIIEDVFSLKEIDFHQTFLFHHKIP